MSDPTARTLALLGLLQTHRNWKGSELADRLEVSERTVRRDVDRLRSLGYRVDAGPGTDGGYRLAVGAHVPPLLLDDDEAVALVLGLRASALSAIEGIEETTVGMMAKLDLVLPDRVRRRVDALHGSVDVLAWSPPTETVSASTLTLVGRCCRDREEMRFEYRRRDGEESSRLVQPLSMVSVGRRWYLVAWDVRRADWRTFRVDRIAEPREAGARFSPRELPAADPAAFVAASLRSAVYEHEARVEVAADADDLEHLARRFGATVEVADDSAGRPRTVLRLSTDSEVWLASMIAMLAVAEEVVGVDASDDVVALLGAAGARLGRLED